MQELQEKACDIRTKCGQPFISQQIDLEDKFQFSMGTAFYPMDGTDFHLLMRVADEKMYQEKKKRKFSGGGYDSSKMKTENQFMKKQKDLVQWCIMAIISVILFSCLIMNTVKMNEAMKEETKSYVTDMANQMD